MLGSKVITFASVLVVLICVVLSITAAPISSPDGLARRTNGNQSDNDTLLQTDEVAVSSNGDGDLTAYDPESVKNINPDVVQNGSKGGNGTKNLRILHFPLKDFNYNFMKDLFFFY